MALKFQRLGTLEDFMFLPYYFAVTFLGFNNCEFDADF